MSSAEFTFVGYLIQEPYLRDARLPDCQLAIMNRKEHPICTQPRYEDISGIPNVTRFLTHLPNMEDYPGWILNGYGIDSQSIVPEVGLDGVTQLPSKYEFARKVVRHADELQSLGFDVIDESCNPMSLIHNLDNSISHIRHLGLPINKWGLFPSDQDAATFVDFIRIANQSDGVVWQVWG
jgi:hypothetical protein